MTEPEDKSEDERPAEEASRKRKFKLHLDEVKLRHTSHWDSDYMSREEFDRYMRGETDPTVDGDAHTAERQPPEQPQRPPTAWERFLATCFGYRKK